MNGHAEPKGADDEHLDQGEEGHGDVRDDFADHELERADGRDDQLLERSQLALAHDRQRGQEHGQELQDDAHQARDHEVGALELRVVPCPGAQIDSTCPPVPSATAR